MEPDSTIKFFGICELVVVLCQHLPLPDLCRFALTNRFCSDIAIPHLWRHVPAEKVSAFLATRHLRDGIHHLGTIDLSLTNHSDFANLYYTINAIIGTRRMESKFLRLKELMTLPHVAEAAPAAFQNDTVVFGLRGVTFLAERYSVSVAPTSIDDSSFYSTLWNQADHEILVKLLQLTPRLTYLQVHGLMLLPNNGGLLSSFLDVVAFSLPKLRHLTVQLEQYTYVPLEPALTFLGQCLEIPSLIELQCEFEIDNATLQSSLLKLCLETIEQRSPERKACRLKSLRLPTAQWPLSFLVPFFKSCVTGLESLCVPWMAAETEGKLTADDFRAALQQSSPAIHHLRVSAQRQSYFENHQFSLFDKVHNSSINAVLQACTTPGSGLRSFVSDGYLDCGDYELDFQETLVRLHSKTLEVVAVHDSWVSYDAWAKFALDSKNLSVLYSNMFLDSSIENRLVTKTDGWAFSPTLKNICLTLGDPPHHHLDRRSQKQVQRSKETFRLFYHHVGGLTELEDWTLGYSGSVRYRVSITDLMLDDNKGGGYLGHLAGLKKLQRLCLWQDFWSRLGEPEIEFIAENWVSLRRITFRTDQILYVEMFLEEMHCWRELKKLRPEIEYEVLCATEEEVYISDYDSFDSED